MLALQASNKKVKARTCRLSSPSFNSNKKSSTSSIEVFLNHIKVVNDREVDVSGVFTRECFLEWLGSRPGTILHPEQSYQRALYAHLRAADHRKPFPENIEESLLKALRHPKDDNPWSLLFGENSLKVGKRGFRKQGFHEAQRNSGIACGERDSSSELSTDISHSNPKRKSLALKKRREFKNGQKKESVKDFVDCLKVDQNFVLDEEDVELDLGSFLSFHMSPAVDSNRSCGTKSSESLSDEVLIVSGSTHMNLQPITKGGINQFFYEAICKGPSRTSNTPWDQIQGVYHKYVSPSFRISVMHAATSRGIDVYNAALYFFLHETPNVNDIRFNLDFLVPKPEERFFRPDREIGTVYFRNGSMIIGQDEAATRIFKGSIVDLHTYELKASFIAHLYTMLKWLPDLMTTGVGWKRETLKRCDGVTMLCLTKTVLLKEGHIVAVQDISDLYPEVTVDVTGVFKKECFQHWLRTRATSIKHEEQSYQRALYAHLKGTDHRRPFPSRVEAALLLILRSPSANSPWKELFPDTAIKLGRRGFRKKGFHESKEERHSLEFPDFSSITSQSKDQVSMNENERSSVTKDSEMLSEIEKTLNVSLNLRRKGRCGPMEASRKRQRQDQLTYNVFQPIALNPYLNLTYNQENNFDQNTPWAALTEAFRKYFPMNIRAPALQAMTERKVNIYTPALFFLMQQKPPENDARFDWDFLLPVSRERMFAPSLRTGHIVLDYRWVIVAQDTAAIDLFGGSVLDNVWSQLFSSFYTLLFGFIKHIEQLSLTGEVWRRDFWKRHDGSTFLVFFRVLAKDKELIISFQDHSDFYPTLLTFPFFV